jgi:hypothetical protein
MNLPVTQKHFLSFSRKLFLSVISLFLVFAACFMAVERMLKEELLPVPGVLNAARELILQMKKDKADGRSSGAAIEKFLDEVKPIKN